MSRNALVPIFAVVFIDLLGFSLILPLLPYYAETFGASAFEVGLLVAVYAAAQLVGAPLLGRMSDRHGRRPVLMLSIAGGVVGFLMLAVAQSLWMLYASRLVAGLFGGNISVAQAYITDVTDDRNRSKGLGMIGAAFGLGFIIGPATGGLLSGFGYWVPASAAAFLGLANFLAVTFMLPESLTAERKETVTRRSAAPLSLLALRAALARPTVGTLLRARFFFGLAFSTFQSVFVLYAQYRLGLTAQSTGYLLAYVGMLSVVVQAVLVGRLAARFDEARLIFGGTALMALSMLGWSAAPDIIWLLIVLAPLSVAGGVLNTVLNSALTKSVRREEYGGILGLGAAVESTTRVISPTLGSLLLEWLGAGAPGVFGAAILAGLSVYLWDRLGLASSRSGLTVIGPLGSPPAVPVPIETVEKVGRQ